MSPLFAETEEKIFGDVMFDIVNDTVLTRSSPGSKTRALSQAVSKKMGRMWAQFDINIIQSFLERARGRYLDFIGNMMGVERLGEQPAAISSSDRVVKFKVDLGTFGDINGDAPIFLPAGVTMSTSPGGVGIRYTLPFSVILPAASSEFFVTVEAARAGSSSNLGANTLVHHDFNTYSDAVNNTLKVTNDSEVESGRDVETDINYRFRIANQVVGSENANKTAIRLAALIVPGVSDVVLLPFNRGIGTFDLMIKSTVPVVPEGLLEAVAQSVDGVTSFGLVPVVRAPSEIGMSLVGTLTTRRVLSASEQTGIIRAVTDNVSAYINNLDIAEEFIVNEVVERVLATSDLIKNIGETAKPLDSIFIFRPSRLEDGKVRERLVTDFTPQSDERLIVETKFAGTTPILFRIAT